MLFHDEAKKPVPDIGAKKEKERMVKTLCISNSTALAEPFGSWSIPSSLYLSSPLIAPEDYKVMLQKMVERSKISALKRTFFEEEDNGSYPDNPMY